MTALLEQAFAEASKRSLEEQDLLATRLLAELTAEDAFDRAIAGSVDKLANFARQAIDENRAGQTADLEPDRL